MKLVSFVLAANCLCLLQQAYVYGTNTVCTGKPADIVLVIDESNSIWGVHFEQLRNFLADLSESFPLGSNATRFSALTFGNAPRQIFSFDDHTTSEDLSDAIRNIQQAGGTRTNTHLALELARESEVSSMRADAARVMILVTDGVSREPEKTREEAEALEVTGITRFVVGISEEVNDAENEMIASDPANDHYFKIDSFGDLSTALAGQVAIKTCEQMPNDAPQQCVADVIFNLASIYQSFDRFEYYFSVTTRLIESFVKYNLGDVHKNLTIGIVPQSCYPQVGMPLASCTEFITHHLEVVVNFRPSISKHISDMTSQGFTVTNGAREGVKNVGIIIVDQVLDYEAVSQAVEEAQLNGIELIAIGVGKNIGDEELTLVAGGDPTHKFSLSEAPDEAEIQSLIQRLYSIVCA